MKFDVANWSRTDSDQTADKLAACIQRYHMKIWSRENVLKNQGRWRTVLCQCTICEIVQCSKTIWSDIGKAIRQTERDLRLRNSKFCNGVGIFLDLGDRLNFQASAFQISSLFIQLDSSVKVDSGRDEINVLSNMCW